MRYIGYFIWCSSWMFAGWLFVYMWRHRPRQVCLEDPRDGELSVYLAWPNKQGVRYVKLGLRRRVILLPDGSVLGWPLAQHMMGAMMGAKKARWFYLDAKCNKPKSPKTRTLD